EDEDFEILSL
nr:Chain E, Cysteine protease ATG4B [Homo sapiens]5LXH_F Chain F, Cysteine protease ATG4B [Homo sapiens]5LXH_G Chain G, Cysteine protease ATG4B [Homo sapiens]